jgi:hypothetical protein
VTTVLIELWVRNDDSGAFSHLESCKPCVRNTSSRILAMEKEYVGHYRAGGKETELQVGWSS